MIRLIGLVLSVLLALSAPAAANPFTGKPGGPAAAAAGTPSHGGPAEAAEGGAAWGPIAWVGRALLTFQREANRMIAQHMRAIRQGDTSVPLLVGACLAFLYGVVHALGPGHGKLVVMSYFLSREARLGRGLLMGLQIAIFHVLSAMIVVALADLLLRRAFDGPPAEVAGLRLASYGLIGLIGLVMLFQAARRSRLRRAGIDVSHACCGHARADHRAGHGGVTERAEQGTLSLGVGLVPCTGAVLILLYAMANDILFAGMLLVTAIAAGMAITMAALGFVSVVMRRTVARRIEAGDHGQGRLAVAMDYAGPLAITALGAGLFWAALR